MKPQCAVGVRIGLSVLVVAIAMGPLQAGGTGFRVKVVQYDRDLGQVQLKPTSAVPELGNCSAVTIDLRYDWLRWWWNGRAGVTREGHNRSVAAFEAAAKEGAELSFGVIGEGLGETGEACHYRSNGLSLVTEAGTSTIYSFFRAP